MRCNDDVRDCRIGTIQCALVVSLATLATHLAPFEKVRFALLFGSRAGGAPRPDSDLDVAVFLDPDMTADERWQARLDLQATLEQLGAVDVVILNDVPPLLAHRALLGRPIEIRDRPAYVRFFVRSLAEAEDERHYRELRETARRRRVKECGLVDRDVFDRRLARLEQLLRDLRALSGRASRDAFLRDRGLQAQAERWLHLAVECVLDLANHLIADRGWRTPTTYRETFAVLREQDVIDDELAQALAGWAGLRNVLVHLYLEVDQTRIWQILTRDLDQLESMAAAVATATAGD